MYQITLRGIKLYPKAFGTLLIHWPSSNDLSDYEVKVSVWALSLASRNLVNFSVSQRSLASLDPRLRGSVHSASLCFRAPRHSLDQHCFSRPVSLSLLPSWGWPLCCVLTHQTHSHLWNLAHFVPSVLESLPPFNPCDWIPHVLWSLIERCLFLRLALSTLFQMAPHLWHSLSSRSALFSFHSTFHHLLYCRVTYLFIVFLPQEKISFILAGIFVSLVHYHMPKT